MPTGGQKIEEILALQAAGEKLTPTETNALINYARRVGEKIDEAAYSQESTLNAEENGLAIAKGRRETILRTLFHSGRKESE